MKTLPAIPDSLQENVSAPSLILLPPTRIWSASEKAHNSPDQGREENHYAYTM